MSPEKQTKRLVAYLRVSTDKQKEEKTIDQQEFMINNFIKNSPEPLEIVEFFKDDGVSGKLEREEREDYFKMIQFLELNPEIYGIIVSSYDRLGRDAFELKAFRKDMDRLSKRIIMLDMSIDSSTKDGKLVLGIFDEVVDYIATGIKDRLWKGRVYKRDQAKKGLIEYREGRKPLEVPKKIKDKMINWYKDNKLGFRAISRLLQTEPDIIKLKEKYAKENKNPKFSAGWVKKRLDDWDVEIRSPEHRKTGKKIDYEKIKQENLKK